MEQSKIIDTLETYQYAENTFFRIELAVVCSEVVECEPQVVY